MQPTIITPSNEPTFDVLGNLIQFLNEPRTGQGDISFMIATLPVGTLVPLHSHADPELFFLLKGSLEVYQETAGWNAAASGQLITIPGNIKHAVRNASDEVVRAILVSKAGIYDFFRELARPFKPESVPNPPTPEELTALFTAASRHGYWIGSPVENAAIGITLP